jgi:hypothetical protein
MAGTDQPDDHETEVQTDLFGAEPVPAYRPDPERVHRLGATLVGVEAENPIVAA